MARASRGERWEKEKSPFATRLRLLMNEQPITTQTQLAEITGKTRQTISQYVNGVSEPGYDTLVKIADHFEVSLDYLLGRTADPDMQTSAVDELGLSPKAIEWFKIFVKNETDRFDYEDTELLFNSFFEDETFTVFFFQMCSFLEAKTAEYIYKSLLIETFSLDESDDSSIYELHHDEIIVFNKKLRKALKTVTFPHDIPENTQRENYIPHSMVQCLEAIIELGDTERGQSDIIELLNGLFSLRISELPEFRIKKACDRFIRNLDQQAEIYSRLENIPKCLLEAMRGHNGND